VKGQVEIPAEPQYENLINQGLSTMGKRIWHAATSASGKRTAHDDPGIRHSRGRRLVEKRIIMQIARKLTSRASQNRFKIRGTSMKKWDFSTSFFVAPHVMLYEKRCASNAWDKWIDRPPKKKKLRVFQ
jgi:hypothetical protein